MSHVPLIQKNFLIFFNVSKQLNIVNSDFSNNILQGNRISFLNRYFKGDLTAIHSIFFCSFAFFKKNLNILYKPLLNCSLFFLWNNLFLSIKYLKWILNWNGNLSKYMFFFFFYNNNFFLSFMQFFFFLKKINHVKSNIN
jgi:hypothetical protein